MASRIAPSSLLLILALFGCPDHSFDRAKALEAEGRLAEAAEIFRTLAERDPSNVPAWDRTIDIFCHRLVDLSQCTNVLDLELKVLGNIDRHRDALSETLELRARQRLEQGMAAEALTDLQRAGKASPWRASVQVAMAKAYLALGQRGEAEACIKRAREIDPHQAEADTLLPELPDAPEDGFGGPPDAQ